MIKLDVKNYCHDCEHFVAEVEGTDIPYFTSNVLARAGDTVVRCEHRNICESLVSRISTKEQTKCDHVWAWTDNHMTNERLFMCEKCGEKIVIPMV